jgi:flagellar biosynthesis/type III secretory pathway M-ring protein FliF/YscJ
MSFEEPQETGFVTPPVWQRFLPQIMEGARIGAALLLSLVLFQFGLRPMVGRVTAALSSGRVVAGGGQLASGEQVVAEISQHGKIEALSTHATSISTSEPETAARLVRVWLDEEKR